MNPASKSPDSVSQRDVWNVSYKPWKLWIASRIFPLL